MKIRTNIRAGRALYYDRCAPSDRCAPPTTRCAPTPRCTGVTLYEY